jgi:hypothetical protein
LRAPGELAALEEEEMISRPLTHALAVATAVSLVASCKTPTPKKTATQESPLEEAEPLSGTCGTERWSIKTGTDSQAGQIAVGHPQATTIGTLGALPAPHTLPSQRISPTELTEFTLKNVTVKAIKTEADSDYHLVLTDATGATMVAEIPAPQCIRGTSPWSTQIAAARQVIAARFGDAGWFPSDAGPFTATLAGIGFFDNPHGQTGDAPNSIELHPTIAICIGQDCPL